MKLVSFVDQVSDGVKRWVESLAQLEGGDNLLERSVRVAEKPAELHVSGAARSFSDVQRYRSRCLS
jgi:hypothetical protein